MCVDVVQVGDPSTLLCLPDTIPDLPVPVSLVFVEVGLVGGRALILVELFIAPPLPVWVEEVRVEVELLPAPLPLESACCPPPDPGAEPCAMVTIYQLGGKRKFTVTKPFYVL